MPCKPDIFAATYEPVENGDAAPVKTGSHQFFAFDSECGFDTYATAEEARTAAQSSLDEARDDADYGWGDAGGGWVTSICWGRILGSVVMSHSEPAPEGSEFDEVQDYELRDEVRVTP